MTELADGCVRLRTEYLDLCGVPLFLHAYAGPDGILLLDSGVAGTPETSLRGELAAAGLRIEDVSLVVNSHAHPDHMGGNSALAAIADPVFAGPAAEAVWLEDNDQLIRQLWEPNPDAFRLGDGERADLVDQLGERVRVERLLRDADRIEASGAALTVVSTSGHSPGHLALHDAERGLLFTFDDVQGAGLPVAGSEVWLAPLYHDVDRYLAGLRRLSTLDFDRLVPSHGEPLDRAAGLARITASIDFVATADEFTRAHLDQHGSVRLGELAAAIGTRLGPYGGVTLQTMSIARAHLDHLVRAGAAAPTWHRTDPGGQS